MMGQLDDPARRGRALPGSARTCIASLSTLTWSRRLGSEPTGLRAPALPEFDDHLQQLRHHRRPRAGEAAGQRAGADEAAGRAKHGTGGEEARTWFSLGL